jgi:hypothetical protein
VSAKHALKNQTIFLYATQHFATKARPYSKVVNVYAKIHYLYLVLRGENIQQDADQAPLRRTTALCQDSFLYSLVNHTYQISCLSVFLMNKRVILSVSWQETILFLDQVCTSPAAARKYLANNPELLLHTERASRHTRQSNDARNYTTKKTGF